MTYVASVLGEAMRRFTFLVFAVMLPASFVFGQSTDHVELFGGYSYFAGNFTAVPGHDSPHGWNASVNVKADRWVGLDSDFSGFYRSDSTGDHARATNFLFGPRVSLPTRGFTPFAHFLVGFSHVNKPGGAGFLTSSNSFAYAFGGGLDYSLTRHFAIRGQADLLHNGFNTGDNQLQIRVDRFVPRMSTGLVFRF
jgi:opacity protein-like surface antigen